MENTLPCSYNFHRRLIAIIAQEVKVPLANALFLIKLANEKPGRTDTEELLKSLEKQLNSAHSIFSELLGWSRTYYISSDSGVLNLRTITEDIIKFSAGFNTADHIAFSNNIPSNLSLPGSYTEVYKFVLRSLILTGIRFSPAGSRCAVDAIPEISGHTISVSVQSTGIPMEQAGKILSESGTFIPEEIAGSDWAISLLLCRDCISELGGKLWMDSASPVFYFRLPSV